MRLVDPRETAGPWDLVVVGSGFGSLFFLKKYLALRPRARVLILEWGRHNTTEWQIENQTNSDISHTDTFVNRSPKEWLFTVGLGGSTNCWWAQSPRLHPSDFTLQSRWGVGVDWPVTYSDLVPHYQEAERIMLVAGPDDLDDEFPQTGAYPQPAHRMSSADEILRRAPGHRHYVVPNARLTRPVDGRGVCCSSAVCNLCPTGAKFTALNGLADVLGHRSVSICTGARVRELGHVDGGVKNCVFTQGGRSHTVAGEAFVLGANAIFNPWIMMKSGIGGQGLGRYLGEKMYPLVEVWLDGHQHFDGGTATTCFNLSHLDGEHRREMGAVVHYFDNMITAHGLRMTPGRWREIMQISPYVEDLLLESNGIFDEGGDLPTVRHAGYGDYAYKGLDRAMRLLPDLLKPLPVEKIEMREVRPALGHLQGTTRMGASREDSVVDHALVHHNLRNLVVVGTSVFPTTGSVNPSLTAAALSLRAAEHFVAEGK